jgi:predicted phage terminase large subunit-like protein
MQPALGVNRTHLAHQLTVEAACALELLRRRRARASLVEYARSIDIPGVPLTDDETVELFKPVEQAVALHHRIMLQAIEQTMLTFMGRLMIFGPPGMAKSSYASVVAPTWAMKRWSGYRIIIASYAANIAEKQSRNARALARQPREVRVWRDRPRLNNDQRAVSQWALSNGSEYMSAGFQGGITGNRANGFIIDDPVAGREEADSPTVRDKTFDEYNDTVTTRLLPGGWIILIQTRWHPDDLSGRILPEKYNGESGRILCRDGQYWQVLNFTAKCERGDDPLGRAIGEYIWPEWFSRTNDPFDNAHWSQWENNPRASRTWAALYQQRPVLGEGLDFKRAWFNWYDDLAEPGAPGGRPELLTIYGASDYATLENRGDYTEHGVFGLAENDDIYVLDWWYGQKTTDVTIDHFIEMIKRHKPRQWWNEGGAIDHAIRPAIEKAMSTARPRCYVTIDNLPSIKNKAIKLNAFQAMASTGEKGRTTGNIYLPRGKPWATRLLDQLCSFPAVVHDDACDVCGLFGRGIDKMKNPHKPASQERKQLIPFTPEWLESTDMPAMQTRYT